MYYLNMSAEMEEHLLGLDEEATHNASAFSDAKIDTVLSAKDLPVNKRLYLVGYLGSILLKKLSVGQTYRILKITGLLRKN